MWWLVELHSSHTPPFLGNCPASNVWFPGGMSGPTIITKVEKRFKRCIPVRHHARKKERQLPYGQTICHFGGYFSLKTCELNKVQWQAICFNYENSNLCFKILQALDVQKSVDRLPKSALGSQLGTCRAIGSSLTVWGAANWHRSCHRFKVGRLLRSTKYWFS